MSEQGAVKAEGPRTASLGRRTRTPSADVTRELLCAAETVLVREGVAGLTVRAVAAEAGVAAMGVYNRFGGKIGLVAALLIRGFGRLRAAIETDDEPDVCTRLHACCLRYREFALANPRFYAILFDEAIFRERGSAEAREYAAACFGVLVRNVELAVAVGALAAPDAREAAQQIWSALHGAVALELKGIVQTPDPAASYRALLDTILRGIPPPDVGYFRDDTASSQPRGWMLPPCRGDSIVDP
jgi:AcrR family transcriptional regulator